MVTECHIATKAKTTLFFSPLKCPILCNSEMQIVLWATHTAPPTDTAMTKIHLLTGGAATGQDYRGPATFASLRTTLWARTIARFAMHLIIQETGTSLYNISAITANLLIQLRRLIARYVESNWLNQCGSDLILYLHPKFGMKKIIFHNEIIILH